jgi:hypothetical protein
VSSWISWKDDLSTIDLFSLWLLLNLIGQSLSERQKSNFMLDWTFVRRKFCRTVCTEIGRGMVARGWDCTEKKANSLYISTLSSSSPSSPLLPLLPPPPPLPPPPQPAPSKMGQCAKNATNRQAVEVYDAIKQCKKVAHPDFYLCIPSD